MSCSRFMIWFLLPQKTPAEKANPSTVFIEGVAGTVTYDVVSEIATFTPSANLAAKSA